MDHSGESNNGIPKVSIGLPAYNSAKYLREALDSLLAQTFTDFELIISDDASTDETSEICQEYMTKDRRIRYIRQPQNTGMAANQNFVFQQARGEFFMWAGHDDKWDKEFIKTLLNALVSNERYTSAFCPYVHIDEAGEIISDMKYLDFSSRSRIVRLLKLCLHYGDWSFYGLHKRKAIKNARIPVWWWINSAIPVNSIYPVVFYCLSVGEYVTVGKSPLLFYRVKKKPYPTSFRSAGFLGEYFAFVLRKVNLLYESALSVYRGTRSMLVVYVILPALIGRCVYDCLQKPIHYCYATLQRLLLAKNNQN
jgi:glycosyltransferase involved in cell wall biosynthesis